MAGRARHRFVSDAPDAPADSVRGAGAERVSRSQRKRDSAALQARGEKLALLPPAQQALLPLPSDLAGALADFRAMSSREARRRQLQYIGRLMREADEAGTLQPVLDAWARLE
ncbi:MAG: DUF615 domain-containing protein [Desulfovibrionaceae bacterium]|nr:DUF615 domain-containing protein [Desulfovibrionaceae bacterium]